MDTMGMEWGQKGDVLCDIFWEEALRNSISHSIMDWLKEGLDNNTYYERFMQGAHMGAMG